MTGSSSEVQHRTSFLELHGLDDCVDSAIRVIGPLRVRVRQCGVIPVDVLHEFTSALRPSVGHSSYSAKISRSSTLSRPKSAIAGAGPGGSDPLELTSQLRIRVSTC